nr:hypothetical protein [Tanacetum cinerariifolium]
MANQRTMAELLRAPTEGTTNLRNEISNFQQRFDESFHEEWDRYKDLLRACHRYSFTKLHQLDTFYNALNPADQDSLNAAAGGNLLERHTQDVLTIIKNKYKVRNFQNKSVVSQVKSRDANSNSSEIAKLTHAVNQQTSIVTTAMTAILKQFQATPPPASVKAVEEIYVTCGGAHPYYQCLVVGGNTFPKLRDNIQGYVSAAVVNYNQGNFGYRPLTITTRSGLVVDGPTVPTHPPFINPEEDERVEETLTDPDLAEYTIKFPTPSVQKYKPSSQRDFVVHQRDPLHPNIPYPSRMLKQKQQEKDETVGALIDVHGEEMILCNSDERLTLNMRHDTSSYSNQPQKESINLINVFNNSSEDFLEDLFSNQPSGNSTFSELTSPEVNDDIFDLEGGNVLPKKLLDLYSTKDLHPPLHVNPLSGSTTCSSSTNPLLEEFADKLALIIFPLKYDDDLQFDIKFDLKDIEFLLYQDIDSSLEDSIDQRNISNLADNFVDSMPEMFTDEHAPDYSSPLIFDEYDDDFLEVESDAENVYDDPFDSKGEKIKESKLLIDELDLPCDFLFPSEYDSFIFQDFSRVDALPSTNNEDKIFNPGILVQEKSFEIITRVVQDKKLAIPNASLVLEDFDPPFYKPLFFKEVPRNRNPYPFSPSRLILSFDSIFHIPPRWDHDPADLSQQSPQNCPKCGHPVDGQYCQGCALLRKKFKEDLFTYCNENGILQDSSEPSNDNTNVVNALREPFVVNQDPGENSLQSHPQINHHCCYECGDPLEDIFCDQCTCELCGKGAHYTIIVR